MAPEEEHIIAAIKKAIPSVVSIAVSKHLEDAEKDIANGLYELPASEKTKKGKIPDSYIDKDGMVQVGGSSGFIVDASGLILTNKHVISDAQAQYTVVMADERKFPATIVSRDPINDVAILKIEADNLPALALGDASGLELGRTVIAIGNALGIFKNTVSKGIVSGLSRSILAQADPNTPPQEMRGLIQTDAAINPGNSGGPLVTLDGTVVGINAAIVSGAQNIGFAIPINAAERDLSDLKQYGRICRPFLGVRYITIDENIQTKMKLPIEYGALITKEGLSYGVAPDSPAAKAGLKEKDIILTLNGKNIDRDHPIQDFLENLSVGDSVKLEVLRNGKKFVTDVLLAEKK